ncbi:MAG: hypothetical protein NZM00_10885 [Anaerolinea sp.]|nr:hypothetical protein [Anaerolinea sp.]
MTTQSQRLLALGLVFVLMLGLIPVLLPRLLTGPLALPTLLVLITTGLFLLVRFIQAAQAEQTAGKRKRQRDERDVLDAIDQLIDSLDDEQIRYLSDRLEQRRRLIDRQLNGDTSALPDQTTARRDRSMS